MVPLSFAQQRLWFIAQLEGPSAVYNTPVALRLDGDLDRAALEAALGDAIARHEVLRTVFPAVEGSPASRSWAWRSWAGGCPSPGRPRRTWPPRWPRRRPSRSTWPLTSRCGRGCWLSARRLLVLVLHHIATDGWSTGVLARDLAAAYAARREGRARDGGPLLPVQYADYAIWQRELLGDADDPGSLLSRQGAWWRHALAGAPTELALPADRPRPAAPSHRGHTVRLEIPPGAPAAGRASPRAGRDDVHAAAGRPGRAAVQARCGHRHPSGDRSRGPDR